MKILERYNFKSEIQFKIGSIQVKRVNLTVNFFYIDMANQNKLGGYWTSQSFLLDTVNTEHPEELRQALAHTLPKVEMKYINPLTLILIL